MPESLEALRGHTTIGVCQVGLARRDPNTAVALFTARTVWPMLALKTSSSRAP